MDAIVVENLTKTYGGIVAVDGLSFAVRAGRVTGFLGPNGAGKTTTLRTLLGLVHPTAGSATFAGVPYAGLDAPLRRVGAVLEATTFHPGRRAADHLAVMATAGGIPGSQVGEVLAAVGLAEAARRRVGGFSLGMRQRLALATALLGDPEILVLDEPTNGLDPDGVRWLRGFLRAFAAQGRTVLVSSHLLAEVAQTVDDVVIVNHGRLVTEGSLADLERLAGPPGVVLRTPQADRVGAELRAAGLDAAVDGDRVVVVGATPDQVGRAVAGAGLTVHEMRAQQPSLEELFLALTRTPAPAPAPAGRGEGVLR
ncbi:MAG TPA: ATP-binding cassette domain-containing protein [Acidimicrobiales bacterium]|nr:ATP-binding cassette domain-containing protein [Acidimicrobiales bacterium]